jgi:hypothetical protein
MDIQAAILVICKGHMVSVDRHMRPHVSVVYWFAMIEPPHFLVGEFARCGSCYAVTHQDCGWFVPQ